MLDILIIVLQTDDHAVVVMRIESDGVSVRENNSSSGPFCMALEMYGDITLAVSIFMAYFLWEELELPPSMEPMTMVLTVKLGSFLNIFERNGEGGGNNRRCGSCQFYYSPTIAANVLTKRVHMCGTLMLVGVVRGF